MKNQSLAKQPSTRRYNMSMVHRFTLAAGFVLATALTFSCSSDSDNGGDGNGTSSGSNGTGGGTSSGSEDSGIYESVKIGTQVWMKKNLNIEAEGSKCYGEGNSSFTEDEVQENCEKYGRLYTWEAAITACPAGWHLSTRDEWDALQDYIKTDKGCPSCDAKHLKAVSGWGSNGNGLDSYGFTAMPGGHGNSNGNFANAGEYGNWWGASESNGTIKANRRRMENHQDYAKWITGVNLPNFLSVRCVKN